MIAVDVEVHKDGGVNDFESGTYEDTEEVVFLEFFVLPPCVGGFPFCHTLVAFEDNAGEYSDVDAVVTELAHKAAVAEVDSFWYHTEVADVVIERVAVDMVNGVTGRDVAFKGDVFEAGEEHVAIPTCKL